MGPWEKGILCRKQRRDSPGRPSRGLLGEQSRGQTFHMGAGGERVKEERLWGSKCADGLPNMVQSC